MIGSPHQSPAMFAGCSFTLFGYLYEVVDLALAMQKAPMSRALEKRKNRSYLAGLAAAMQRQVLGPACRQSKKAGHNSGAANQSASLWLPGCVETRTKQRHGAAHEPGQRGPGWLVRARLPEATNQSASLCTVKTLSPNSIILKDAKGQILDAIAEISLPCSLLIVTNSDICIGAKLLLTRLKAFPKPMHPITALPSFFLKDTLPSFDEKQNDGRKMRTLYSSVLQSCIVQ